MERIEPMSIRTNSKETTMATRNPTTTCTDTQPKLTAFRDDDRARAIRMYAKGQLPDEIAAATDADLETVARRLRRAGVLAPYDDPRALAHLYHDHEHTLESLAAVFDHARGSESIRFRMEKFGIERDGQTTVDLLDLLDPEDVGLSPTTDDDHAKFTKRGRST